MSSNRIFCKDNISVFIQLLVCERIKPHVLIISLADLYKKYPLIIEDYNESVFGLLHHPDLETRIHIFNTLTHLVTSDMIRVKNLLAFICKFMYHKEDRDAIR